MSIIKHVTLQKIVAHDFRYDPRSCAVVVVVSAPRTSSIQWRCLAGVECDRYYCNYDVLMVSSFNGLCHLTVAGISKTKRFMMYVS